MATRKKIIYLKQKHCETKNLLKLTNKKKQNAEDAISKIRDPFTNTTRDKETNL